MIKSLHIICLFSLLSIGLIGCEKENIISIPENTPTQYFFTIKDTSEYNNTDYHINTDVRVFPSSNSSIEFDIDNDNIFDIKLMHQSAGNNGSGSITTTLINLTSDSSLTFSVRPNSVYFLKPYKLNNTIKESDTWSHRSNFTLVDIDYSPNGEYFFYWNYGDSNLKYIGFRKKVGTQYKYGWFMISSYYGLSVMEL